VAGRIPDNFDPYQYYKLDPACYDWRLLLNLSGDCCDAVASPHPYIYVGSKTSIIPEIAQIVLNTADDCAMRPDICSQTTRPARIATYFHIALTDPPSAESPRRFADAVHLVCMIASRSRPIFVHCVSGMNRSISVAATATAILSGTDVVDVLIGMSKQRPEVCPDVSYIIMGQWLNGELDG